MDPSDAGCELSVVIPCLNEAETLATCIRKARAAIEAHTIDAEIVVADNGSTDGSQDIARQLGARVVAVAEKGYGNALIGGIGAARGELIIMGDADDSYDFGEIPRFVDKLRQSYDLVQGCRLPSGGGTVAPGAMPFLHRWLGNPMFSRMARVMFRAPIHDIYCGLRGFTRSFYERLNMRCTGMEFAVEMILKASLVQARIAEIPITLHPDGRQQQRRHLRTFRDGWRTLRFLLLYAPNWLFWVPGALLVALGGVGFVMAYQGVQVGNAVLGAHSLLFASLAILIGFQATTFGFLAMTFAIGEQLRPSGAFMDRFFRLFNLERGLVAGAVGWVAGIVLLGFAFREWQALDFGRLDYAHSMRRVIPGVLLAALGSQTILASFLASILGLRRR